MSRQIDAGYTAQLFCQLGGRGDTGFFHSVEIAVDAGVNGAQGNGQGDDAQHGGRPLFQKERTGDPLGELQDEPGAQAGEYQGGRKAYCDYTGGGVVVSGRSLRCHMFGDGGLQSRGRDGEGKGGDGPQQLIDAHAFLAEQS